MSGQHRHFVRSAKAQPTSVILVSAVIVLVAAAGLAFWVWDGADTDSSDEAPAATAEPTGEPEPTGEAEPTEEPELTPSDEPAEPSRDLTVNVYNRTSVSGLAARKADQARTAGWTVAATGNWRGGDIPADTVYYPEGEQSAAELLADDLGIGRVAPRVDPMPAGELSVILISGT